jgi:hypothetical protein
MNCNNLKKETLETYKNDSKSTLRTLVFLTKTLKNLHTPGAVFYFLFAIVFGAASAMFCFGAPLLPMFIGATVIHFCTYMITLNFIFNQDELHETYMEQSCIQETLEEILSSK